MAHLKLATGIEAGKWALGTATSDRGNAAQTSSTRSPPAMRVDQCVSMLVLLVGSHRTRFRHTEQSKIGDDADASTLGLAE